MTDRQAILTREQFNTLLDTYGARIERWPFAHQAAAGQLLGTDENARSVLGEARALEALLDRATSATGTAPRDLVDRIVAAAVKPQVVPAGEPARPATNIVPLASGQVPAPDAPRPRRTDAFGVKRLPAAAALAASLVLGIAIGSHDLVHAPMRGLIELASIDSSDNGLYRLVSSLHSDGVSAAIDEDAP